MDNKRVPAAAAVATAALLTFVVGAAATLGGAVCLGGCVVTRTASTDERGPVTETAPDAGEATGAAGAARGEDFGGSTETDKENAPPAGAGEAETSPPGPGASKTSDNAAPGDDRAASSARTGQRSAEERAVIDVVRDVRPAVISVLRNGGSGSGVIIRQDGVILTNAHVVGDASVVGVRFADGKTVEGRVLGSDPAVDIAVVKVKAGRLPTAPFADSDKLEVGQDAIAIGNPLGLEGTVTTGVVSATNRQRDPSDFVGFIQTDAAINPGNSGGPLLDSDGRVIGINTFIFARGAQGLGFAVPINVARDTANPVSYTHLTLPTTPYV